MKHVDRSGAVALTLMLAVSTAQAGLADYLDRIGIPGVGTGSQDAAAALGDEEMVAGLREALDRGTQFAVDRLGRQDGFLDNSRVRIPMPDSLAWVDKS